MKCKYCKQKIKGKVAYWKGNQTCHRCFQEKKYDSYHIPTVRRNAVKKRQQYNREQKKEKQRIKLLQDYENLIINFQAIEDEKDNFISSRIWNQFEILKKAYNLGKEIDPNYSIKIMAFDFRISPRHAQRLLSLRYCTKNTLKLIRQGKISVNKVSIITSQKSLDMQNEIVAWVVENQATKQDIISYRTSNPQSQRNIVLDYQRFSNKIESISKLLLQLKKDAPAPLKSQIKGNLIEFRDFIDSYLNQLEVKQ